MSAMQEDLEQQQQIDRLASEVSQLKRHLYWVYAALALFMVLSIMPGGILIAIPIIFIGIPGYLFYRFLRSLAARRAWINERLAPRKAYPRRSRRTA